MLLSVRAKLTSGPLRCGHERWEFGFVLAVLAVLLTLMALGVIGSFAAKFN